MGKNEGGTDLLGNCALAIDLRLKTSPISSTRIFHHTFWVVCWVIPMSFSRWDQCCRVRTAGREVFGVLFPQIILIQGSTWILWVGKKQTVPGPCVQHLGCLSAGRTSLHGHTLSFNNLVSLHAQLGCAPFSQAQSILQGE